MRRIIIGHSLLAFSKCSLGRNIISFGARPSHAEWQGKVYSRSGTSKKYPSLEEATGYGTVTGLCGANCRHTMTPYVEGYSQLPNTDYSMQEERFGMTSDEYYAATQKQRRLEREIRKVKRERAAIAVDGQETVKQDRRIRELQKRLREHVKENHLTRDYSREKVWGISEPLRFSQVSKIQIIDTDSNIKPIAQKLMHNAEFGGQEVMLIDMDGKLVVDEDIIMQLANKGARVKWQKQQEHIEGTRQYEERFKRTGKLPSTIFLSNQAEIMTFVRNCLKTTPIKVDSIDKNGNASFKLDGMSKMEIGVAHTYIGDSIEYHGKTRRYVVKFSSKGFHMYAVPEGFK